MDDVKEFFEYKTLKFWIAVIVIIAIHLIPIQTGEEDITMTLFVIMWSETKSIYFLLGILAIEFVIIIVPFIKIQRYLSEKLNFP